MPEPSLLQRLKERKLVQWGVSYAGPTMPPAAREAFYESGCQGRTGPSLIPGPYGPWQPAPSVDGTRPLGLLGLSGQSFSASFSSIQAPDPLERVQAYGSHCANHGSI
jgi:hypothetical protein